MKKKDEKILNLSTRYLPSISDAVCLAAAAEEESAAEVEATAEEAPLVAPLPSTRLSCFRSLFISSTLNVS